jgi:DNA-binding transcriptional LysR family regulator
MPKSGGWDSRIGRRVKLRDLHILFAVAQHGSMAKAGAHLGMSQSAVSQAIATLEHALEVSLLDRSPHGVEPTLYGLALMRRAEVAFDELRSGVKDIEFLADPEIGEVRIASTQPLSGGFLPAAIERFSQRYPRVKLSVLDEVTTLRGYAPLHERTADVIFTMATRQLQAALTEDLRAEVLFEERICLAAAKHSQWARRRKIGLADLVDAQFIAPPSDTPGGALVAKPFLAAGLPAPSVAVTTFSVHLRNLLSMRGRFIAVLPVSILRFNQDLYCLKELAIDVPAVRVPVLMVTVKNRMLSPPVERFMACAREIAGAMHAAPAPPEGMRARGKASRVLETKQRAAQRI